VDSIVTHVDSEIIPILWRRNRQARRYRLYVRTDGQARLTIPRHGTNREAIQFVEKHKEWLRARIRHFAQINGQAWQHGTEVFYRGTPTRIVVHAPARPGDGPWVIQLGVESITCQPLLETQDLRRLITQHLRKVSEGELPARVFELARAHDCAVTKVLVRNQRTRWGSCSKAGVVSLNWRLVQAPIEVRDYIILHELMHLREMNHSRRFWKHVAAVCPDYGRHEAWLNAHNALLH
jgi:predicted metal-dependent hydrolase